MPIALPSSDASRKQRVYRSPLTDSGDLFPYLHRNNPGPSYCRLRCQHTGMLSVYRLVQRTGLDRVCLSGGVFLNAVLSTALESRLTNSGCTVFTHTQVPPGDGGLSLGQLVLAANQP